MTKLFELAAECLAEKDVDQKVELTLRYSESILSGSITIQNYHFDSSVIAVRPDKPILVPPKDLPGRNIQTASGRAAMIHSFAHIEFNAINLAWDLICRFQDMPETFYQDWAKVAAEEAKHFDLLRKHLQEMGFDYGDFPAHDGLMKIADDTAHDILLRLGVVPRIMEARGLDVTPDLIHRFRQINDHKTVDILKIILDDEIGHVAIGTKWYHYVCDSLNKDPEETFFELMDQFVPKGSNRKINHAARLSAGFSQSELDYISSN